MGEAVAKVLTKEELRTDWNRKFGFPIELSAIFASHEELRRRLDDAVKRLYRSHEELRRRLDETLEALRHLYDAQNGPPLLDKRNKEFWEEGFKWASEILEREGK